MELTAALIVLGHAGAAVALGWLYFRRYALARPPLGVFDLSDLAFMLGGIVLVPLLYLILPLGLVVGLLALGMLSAVYMLGEPVLRARWALWAVVAGLGAADAAAWLISGAGSAPAFAVNNLVVVLAALGIANLWAQSGMKARDAALLGAALAVYDAVATAWLPLMRDLFARVAELPFAPLVAWAVGDGRWVGIGLGDLLLATVFPLVLRKAYGRPAGLVAAVASYGGILAAFGAATLGAVEAFPVMVVLGPLMVAQYAFWSRRCGAERTTWQYLQAEPRRRPSSTPLQGTAPAWTRSISG